MAKNERKGWQVLKRMPAAPLHTALTWPCLSFHHGNWTLMWFKVFWWMKPLLAGLDASIDWINLLAMFRLRGITTGGNCCWLLRLLSTLFWRVRVQGLTVRSTLTSVRPPPASTMPPALTLFMVTTVCVWLVLQVSKKHILLSFFNCVYIVHVHVW